MKCSKCGGTAVINMRQHRLRLCADHFVEWFVSMTQRTIETFKMFTPTDKVLVAVSGGKDSLALWDVLLRLGYRAEGMYIGLGIDEGIGHPEGHLGYSGKSLAMCRKFMTEHHPDAVLHIVDVGAEYGQTIPQLAQTKQRGRGKPCAVCGLVKRYIMNRVALRGTSLRLRSGQAEQARDDGSAETSGRASGRGFAEVGSAELAEVGFGAIATGHNLDDEVAVLMQNTLHWQTGYLARQSPVLEERDGLARKVKPFVRLYERESAAYALVRGIDYIYDECPFAKGSTTNFYKELLNQLELNSPGTKQQFYLQFLRARDAGRVIFKEAEGTDLHPCIRCGQPTTAGDLCAFCRLWE